MKNNYKIQTWKFLLGIFLISLPVWSCRKFVTLPLPSGSIPSAAIFKDAVSLNAALIGIYSKISTSSSYSTTVFSIGSLLSDELKTSIASSYYLAGNNTYNSDTDFTLFTYYYGVLYDVNYVLDGIDTQAASSIPKATINQIKGECLFIRAFCYFNLVNFYGTVPLIKTADVSVSTTAGNTPVATTYQSIIADLQAAGNLLTDTYPVANRTQVNKQTVNTLLAKTYLYTNDYANAISAATMVINSNTLYQLNPDLNSAFLSTSTETIWQYWNSTGTVLANSYVPATLSSVTFSFAARPELVNSFEVGDGRKAAWIGAGTIAGNYYANKWKAKTTTPGKLEYLIQFRLAELYLIRAEAYAQTNKIAEGVADLFTIRKRAGLSVAPAITTQAALLDLVVSERRKELCFEGANRWFDLNRTNRSVAVLTPIKPYFDSHLMLLPFPKNLVTNPNPNLKQNPGYDQ